MGIVCKGTGQEGTPRTLLGALNLPWGGARTARMLADLSPKFIAYARLKVNYSVFLEALAARYRASRYVLELEPLVNELQKFSGHREHVLSGLELRIFGNEVEIRATFASTARCSPCTRLGQAKQDVETLWGES
ncbi:MAG: hypothetical protein KatS3mg081_1637 [Gemmatimonadales bacterium]|nr:MAG: hypothetical protein KatS3mg081_1637 [Gemmatimonadales bacterium]